MFYPRRCGKGWIFRDSHTKFVLSEGRQTSPALYECIINVPRQFPDQLKFLNGRRGGKGGGTRTRAIEEIRHAGSVFGKCAFSARSPRVALLYKRSCSGTLLPFMIMERNNS